MWRCHAAALHHNLAVDPLRWFADFATEKYWHMSDAICQQLQGLTRTWYTAGTYDQLNLGMDVDTEEIARQIQIYVDACGRRGAGEVVVSSSQQHVARQVRVPVWRGAGCVSGDRVGEKSTLREWTVPETTLTRAVIEAVEEKRMPAAGAWSRRNMTSLVAAALGTSSDVAAGLLNSGGLGVALPCVSAKRSRSRVLPEVCDACSHVGRRLSPRDGPIIREMNESVFALDFLETGGVGLSESCEKVGYSTLSTDLASPALHRLHSVITDFLPPSVTESGEAALRRLPASRAIGQDR